MIMLFFFFKQKTAYEMRISDWSSDVCSSDLLPAADGFKALLCGSCSQASRAQLTDLISRGTPAFAIDPIRLARGDDVASEALTWAAPLVSDQPVVIYATASVENIKATQDALGAERAGALVEQAMAKIATGLVAQGVRQLIVAGGETSGRSEEHTSELQSLMRISYAVFCLKKKNKKQYTTNVHNQHI